MSLVSSTMRAQLPQSSWGSTPGCGDAVVPAASAPDSGVARVGGAGATAAGTSTDKSSAELNRLTRHMALIVARVWRLWCGRRSHLDLGWAPGSAQHLAPAGGTVPLTRYAVAKSSLHRL